METYKFNYNDKEYELSENNCDYFFYHEETEITGLDIEKIISILNDKKDLSFELQYYDGPCENCLAGKKEKEKVFKFLEGDFYVFSKNGEYVMSNISTEYENTNFTRLKREGKIDNSYILIIAVCENCGNYFVEIQECDI